MRTKWALVTLAAVLGAAAPAAAEIRQGDVAYIEDDDGSLALYRRLDRPFEGDDRARFQRVPVPEQDAYVRTRGPQGIPIIDRAAVITRSAGIAAVTEGTMIAQRETMAAPPPVQVTEVAYERPMIRGRFGVSAVGGGTVGNSLDDPEGFMGGIALRLGLQLGDWFSVYYQPTGLIADLETSPAGDFYDEAFTLWNSIILETTLFDFVSIGAGPSMDFYWDCEQFVQGQASCADGGAFFGLHGRAAVNIGGALFGQRGAVNLSFDIHPTWFWDDSETLSMLGGLGVELY